MMPNGIGRTAFIAYNNERGGVNFLGEPTPPWDDLPQGIRDAWEKAAEAVLSYNAGVANWRDLLDDPFRPTVQFAAAYEKQWSNVPVIGRNLLLVINALVKILDGKKTNE